MHFYAREKFNMPTILPTIAAIGGLVGGGVSAWGQINQGQSAKQAQETNAQIVAAEAGVSEANAGLIRQNAILNEYRQRKVLAQNTGSQIAGYAKAGVSTTTGSPVDVIADSISNAELDISIEKANSEAEARNQEQTSQAKQTEARLRRLYGREAETNSYYNAASTLLQSGVSAASALSKEKLGSGKVSTPKSYSGGSGYYSHIKLNNPYR